MNDTKDMAAKEKAFVENPKQGPLDEGNIKRPAHVEPEEFPVHDPVAADKPRT